MSRREEGLARNTAWSVADEGLVLASAVLAVLLLIPRLGPAHYGAWAALFALLGPFAALAHIGVRLTILEGIVRDEGSVSGVSRSCISLALLLSLCLAPIVAAAGLLWIDVLTLPLAVLFVGSELVANAWVNSLVSIVQGAVSYARAIQIKLAVGGSRIAVLLVLVALGRVSVENLIYGNALMLFAAVPIVALVARRLGTGTLLPGRILPGHLGTTVTHGLGVGSAIAQNDADKVVLNAYGHREDSGVYAAGYRLVAVVMTPLAAFLSSSHFAVLEAARTSSDQLRKAAVFSGITLAYGLPAIGALVLFGPVVPWLLGEEFRESARILQLVAPIAVIRYVGSFACNGLLGLHRNVLRMWLLVGGALSSLLLYVLLIPTWSWRGALLGSLISELLLAAACWISLYWCQRVAGGGAGPRPPDAPPEDGPADA